MGEIYVIAVAPSMAGKGVGRMMAIAGLQHLGQQGITEAMLYVDADNAAAVTMYSALGFTSHHEEHAFVGDIAPGATS
jgi:mycothiol synthase